MKKIKEYAKHVVCFSAIAVVLVILGQYVGVLLLRFNVATEEQNVLTAAIGLGVGSVAALVFGWIIRLGIEERSDKDPDFWSDIDGWVYSMDIDFKRLVWFEIGVPVLLICGTSVGLGFIGGGVFLGMIYLCALMVRKRISVRMFEEAKVLLSVVKPVPKNWTTPRSVSTMVK